MNKEILYSLILSKYGRENFSFGCSIVAQWMKGSGFTDWNNVFVEWYCTVPNKAKIAEAQTPVLRSLFQQISLLQNFKPGTVIMAAITAAEKILQKVPKLNPAFEEKLSNKALDDLIKRAKQKGAFINETLK